MPFGAVDEHRGERVGFGGTDQGRSVNSRTVQQKLADGIHRHQNGDVSGAARLYAEILSAQPRNPDAWHLSGLIAFQHQQHTDAETCIRQALSFRPGQPDFMANLASVLLATNRAAEAEQVCLHVLAQRPQHPGALQRLGSALLKQERYGAAEQMLRQAVEGQPDNCDALCNLGVALIELRRFSDAERYLQRARAIRPESMQVQLNLGVAQRELGKLADAAVSLDRAISLAPNSAECFLNRGNVRMDQGDASGALADFQRAATLNPNLPTAHNGLGRALHVLGKLQPALAAFDRACELDAPKLRFASNRLYCASLSPELTRRQLFELHVRWGRSIEATVAELSLPQRRAGHRRLRIGYVSPDFRNHATMRFFLPLLKHHSRRSVEVFCYSETAIEDSVTNAVRQNSDGWHCTVPMSDVALAQQIADDEIDVLVDLAGHTAGNRLAAMAAKPAPVQVSFLGYPNSTGLSRIDYFLTDAVRESPDSAEFFTEELILLPNGACCFEAADMQLAESAAPSDANGFITFGSTHRLEKISPQCLALWKRVLDAVPNSRLLVFRDTLSHAEIRDDFRQQLLATDIDIQRVEFDWELPPNHLAVYSRMDILLDVFPWGSGTTAYESMWMGVPIPTIAGDRGACRATASMMHYCGLPELVATCADDYVELVTRLARNTSRLRELRTGIRPAMQKTVCDGQRFAADVEVAFREMMNRHQSPTHANRLRNMSRQFAGASR